MTIKIVGYNVVSGDFIDTENFYMHNPSGKILEINGFKVKCKCNICSRYIPEDGVVNPIPEKYFCKC